MKSWSSLTHATCGIIFSMRDAMIDGRRVLASPEAPNVATCPACGGEVHKCKRRDGAQVTYFYRHKRGVGDGCPRRYPPTRS